MMDAKTIRELQRRQQEKLRPLVEAGGKPPAPEPKFWVQMPDVWKTIAEGHFPPDTGMEDGVSWSGRYPTTLEQERASTVPLRPAVGKFHNPAGRK